MPILKPEIQNALREAGLVHDPSNKSLDELLDNNGLSKDAILQTLGFIMENAGSDQTKLRAVENALKVRGLMKDTPTTVPSITINIIDPSKKDATVDAFLLPREIKLTETVQ